jgi:hypothetical protein
MALEGPPNGGLDVLYSTSNGASPNSWFKMLVLMEIKEL